MSDQIREQMSALLDGELPQDEVGLLVRRMARDVELKRAFGNYVLTGEALRAPGGLTASKGFAARISAAIEAEEGALPTAATIVAPSRSAAHWRRPAAALAVAAGAAFAAVLLVRPNAGDETQFAVRAGAPEAPPLVALPVGGSSPTPAQNQRLATYLVAHGQYATPFGRRNVWSNALATDPDITRVDPERDEAR
jgi:sigma-E factor negative regulatory protein RseA